MVLARGGGRYVAHRISRGADDGFADRNEPVTVEKQSARAVGVFDSVKPLLALRFAHAILRKADGGDDFVLALARLELREGVEAGTGGKKDQKE